MDVVLSSDGKSSINVPSNTALKLSYVVFEALRSAKKLSETDSYFKYASIKDNYQVKVKQDRIIFKPRNVLEIGNPIIELAQAKKTVDDMVANGLTTVYEVIGACIRHRCSITFPDAALSAESFAQLKKWADKNNYSYNEDGILTMTKHEPLAEENDSAKYG